MTAHIERAKPVAGSEPRISDQWFSHSLIKVRCRASRSCSEILPKCLLASLSMKESFVILPTLFGSCRGFVGASWAVRGHRNTLIAREYHALIPESAFLVPCFFYTHL